jgi:hypothetical protein
MFCCPGFQNSVANAGQRGIAALAKRTGEGVVFVLQSRGIAFDDERRIGPMPGAPDIKLNVSCTTGLRYCPVCGRRLQELIEASPRAFLKLAEQHKEFLARDEF